MTEGLEGAARAQRPVPGAPECPGTCGVAGGDASEGPFEEAHRSLSSLRTEGQHGHKED